MFIFQGTSAQKKSYERESSELMQSIAHAKFELDMANENFSYATDPLLVDAYAYQIKAAQAKYSYLLKKLKHSTKN